MILEKTTNEKGRSCLHTMIIICPLMTFNLVFIGLGLMRMLVLMLFLPQVWRMDAKIVEFEFAHQIWAFLCDHYEHTLVHKSSIVTV